MKTFRLIPEKIIQWDKKRTCNQCKKRYYECDEIGQLNCSYHTGKFNNEEKKWSCCNKGFQFDIGCSQKDHMENETEWYVFDKTEINLLFKEIQQIEKFHEFAIIKLHKDQYMCIRRNLNVNSNKIKDKFDTFLKYETKIN